MRRRGFAGAGRAEGDLTPGCAAALAAVLESLSKKAGPEDVRTGAQRRHDALEEACRRLIRAGMVPGRAGQPTQVLVHLTLAQLRGDRGGSAAEGAWAAARASQPGWLAGPDAEAAACDATVVPVVTGHVDWTALDRLIDAFVISHDIGRHATQAARAGRPSQPGASGQFPGPAMPAAMAGGAEPSSAIGLDQLSGGREPAAPGCEPADSDRGLCRRAAEPPRPEREPLSPATRDRLRRALLGLAADALSGPGGLAARLRAALGSAPLTTVSLPLDIGAAAETSPDRTRTLHSHGPPPSQAA